MQTTVCFPPSLFGRLEAINRSWYSPTQLVYNLTFWICLKIEVLQSLIESTCLHVHFPDPRWPEVLSSASTPWPIKIPFTSPNFSNSKGIEKRAK